MYYLTRFRYTAELYGKTRKKTGAVLAEAETFGDAETQAMEYCSQSGLDEADIISVSRSNIREVANPYDYEPGLPGWLVTLEDIFVTEEGKEKKLRYQVLFWCQEMPNANDKLVTDYCLGIDPTGNQMKVVGVRKSDIIAELS